MFYNRQEMGGRTEGTEDTEEGPAVQPGSSPIENNQASAGFWIPGTGTLASIPVGPMA